MTYIDLTSCTMNNNMVVGEEEEEGGGEKGISGDMLALS
jgi:hypothetical protein